MKSRFIVLFVIMIFLTACGGNDTQTGPSNTRSFLGGREGLSFSFMPGEPPVEVTDSGETPFTVSVKVTNRGEADVNEGDLSLTLKGFHAVDFGVNDSELLTVVLNEDIMKNGINPDTGERIVSPDVFIPIPSTGNLDYNGVLSGNYVFPFVVDACYIYETKANAELCIKENLMNTANNAVCSVSGIKNVQNSGAPIQIVKFEEFTAGKDAVSFAFTVENVGQGLLYLNNSGCDITPAKVNVTSISVYSGLKGLTCTGLDNGNADQTKVWGTIKLSGGTRTVRCRQEIEIENKVDMIKLVEINARYDYKNSISTSVLVKHLSE